MNVKRHKIQRLASLEQEMRAVARGERLAPADAARPSFESRRAVGPRRGFGDDSRSGAGRTGLAMPESGARPPARRKP